MKKFTLVSAGPTETVLSRPKGVLCKLIERTLSNAVGRPLGIASAARAPVAEAQRADAMHRLGDAPRP